MKSEEEIRARIVTFKSLVQQYEKEADFFYLSGGKGDNHARGRAQQYKDKIEALEWVLDNG